MDKEEAKEIFDDVRYQKRAAWDTDVSKVRKAHQVILEEGSVEEYQNALSEVVLIPEFLYDIARFNNHND